MHKELQNRFINYISRHQLLSRDTPVLATLSGGKDSMVMASLLYNAGFQFIAAHCNFQLRRENSDQDQALVEKWCSQHNVELYIKTFNTQKYAQKHGISIEMAARDLRYAWFEALRKKINARSVAVAHHMNDQAETVLLNMIRGTGFRGFTGMKIKSGTVIRPLLFATRAEIDNYARIHQVAYREDHTNADTNIKRNHLRHNVIPELLEINPSFVRTMNANTDRLKNISAFLNRHFEKMERTLVTQKNDQIHIEIPDNQYRLIFVDFMHNYCTLHHIPCPVYQIPELLQAQTGKKLLGGAYEIIRERSKIVIKKQQKDLSETTAIESIPAEVQFGSYLFRFGYPEYKNLNKVPVESHKVWLDAETIEFPLQIRKWQAGDRMRPYGLHGSKKIKKMLTDAKIEASDRENFPVVTDKEKIIWLPYIRPHQDSIVKSHTSKVLSVEIVKLS